MKILLCGSYCSYDDVVVRQVVPRVELLLIISAQWLIAVSAIPGGYYCAPIFLQFEEFELYWGAVFFKMCSHIFQ